MKHYITTTLPYVNAKPHIGFALEIVQADAIARFWRMSAHEIIFNTGTDEHGQKIYEMALAAGKDPKEYVDVFAAKFDELKGALNLSYTHFIQTSSEKHRTAAQAFWRACKENGDIYKDRYQTKYCVGCELEKTDSELNADARCPLHPNRDLELRDEENYFFRFSKYQQPLIEFYNANPHFVQPPHRQKEIHTFVEAGLKDFSISRVKAKMPWGVPVPGDEEHVMYVWFDALVNYISTLGWGSDDASEFDAYWPGVQVAGKDNLRQQSAMWQAMLMSANVANSKQVFIHGFITANGQKMSKSLGNVVDPFELVNEYGTDAVRYYLLRELPSAEDGDYSTDRMNLRYAELANQLGNLVSRVAAMSNTYFDGILDKPKVSWLKQNAELEDMIVRYQFKAYADYVFAAVAKANEIIDKEEPFKTVKTDPHAAKKTLSDVAEIIRWVGKALQPIIPEAGEEIMRRYGGEKILIGEALFPRRD
ncbi:MAG: methionine--tRNA ligase [bacterium]|nr:methionine--tRNA ligase [bacterium]